LRKMQVDTNVAESDVGRLSEGMRAGFTVDAYPGERFGGRVRQIRNAPQSVQNVVTYDAVIDVDNTDLRLKPGMTANVSFTYAERKGVLRVPNAALRFRPAADAARQDAAKAEAAKADAGSKDARPAGDKPGGDKPAGEKRPGGGRGARTLYVLRGDALVPVQVTTGVTDGSNTEVTSDALHEGDAVVVDAADKKKSQQPIGRMF
jgi:HlyD family secretion protein